MWGQWVQKDVRQIKTHSYYTMWKHYDKVYDQKKKSDWILVPLKKKNARSLHCRQYHKPTMPVQGAAEIIIKATAVWYYLKYVEA